MTIIKNIVLFSVALVYQIAAQAVTIEPDDYAAGTDLTHISPHVTITTTFGSAVYAATIEKSGIAPAAGNATGPFGDRVFSLAPNNNTEWYWGLDPDFEEGLVLEFARPVTSFSILVGELYTYAGCCSSDPAVAYLYDDLDNLVDWFYLDGTPSGHLGDPLDPTNAFSWWEDTHLVAGVRKIILGGESEPTTFDRLSFTMAPVPVPAAAWFFLSALGSLGIAQWRKAAAISAVTKPS